MPEDIVDIKIEALKELIMLKFDAQESAQKLQAKELARRLDYLNGEADRLQKMQATYLPREVYETHHMEIEKRVEECLQYKATTEGKASQTSVFIAWGFAVIGIILGIMGMLHD